MGELVPAVLKPLIGGLDWCLFLAEVKWGTTQKQLAWGFKPLVFQRVNGKPPRNTAKPLFCKPPTFKLLVLAEGKWDQPETTTGKLMYCRGA